MFILSCVVLMILLVSEITRAADTAAVAAALPDEASECRYLLMLCQQTRIATQNTHRAGQTLGEKVPAFESKQEKYREAKSKAKNKEQALREAGKGGSITATRDARGTLMLYPKREGNVWERKHEEWKKANAEEVKAHDAYLRGYPGTLVGESREFLDSWRTA